MADPYFDPNEALLPGEEPDIRKAIEETIGREWLKTENFWLNGLAPERLIGTPEEHKLRNLLRTLTVAGIS